MLHSVPMCSVVAVDAGVAGNSFVKKNLGGIFREKGAGNIFDADGTLFVAVDALQGSCAAEWLVTAQTLFFQGMMAFHYRAGVKQYMRKRCCQGGENYG